jgi:hypothetical protein
MEMILSALGVLAIIVLLIYERRRNREIQRRVGPILYRISRRLTLKTFPWVAVSLLSFGLIANLTELGDAESFEFSTRLLTVGVLSAFIARYFYLLR